MRSYSASLDCDTPSPAECYAEAVKELEGIQNGDQLPPWIAESDRQLLIEECRQRVAGLEEVKHLNVWPVYASHDDF